MLRSKGVLYFREGKEDKKGMANLIQGVLNNVRRKKLADTMDKTYIKWLNDVFILYDIFNLAYRFNHAFRDREEFKANANADDNIDTLRQWDLARNKSRGGILNSTMKGEDKEMIGHYASFFEKFKKKDNE
jgi:hypothetical protein